MATGSRRNFGSLKRSGRNMKALESRLSSSLCLFQYLPLNSSGWSSGIGRWTCFSSWVKM